jgi:prophage tail gpP-like protein
VADSPLTVWLPLLGRNVTTVGNWEIDSAYLVATDGFQFELLSEDPTQLQGLELQPVELSVNGAQQCLGRIDKTRKEHLKSITCWGRDFIADLTECNVDPSFTPSANSNIQELLRAVASPCGIDVIADNTDMTLQKARSGVPLRVSTPGKVFTTLTAQDLKPDKGQAIYEYMLSIVSRIGATIQPGLSRDTLYIGEPHFHVEPPYSLIRKFGQEGQGRNNVVTSAADRDYSSFPTYTLFSGSSGKPGEKVTPGANEIPTVELAENDELERIFTYGITGSRRKPLDNSETLGEGRLYRLLVLEDEKARGRDQIQAAMRRAIAERLKETLVYTCTVKGHTTPETGAIWSVDTMVNVDDDICDVHEPLWIARRKLKYTKNEGATTELELWRPNAFLL